MRRLAHPWGTGSGWLLDTRAVADIGDTIERIHRHGEDGPRRPRTKDR
ncbi:MAG: hypothetical protein ACRELA_00145 [Candidatus Rokuibacteriota bacterium]